MHPDAEHQERHPDLAKLLTRVHVRDVEWRVRAQQDAGEQEADDRRQAQAHRQQPADQTERQRERQLVHQAQRMVRAGQMLDDLLTNLRSPGSTW